MISKVSSVEVERSIVEGAPQVCTIIMQDVNQVPLGFQHSQWRCQVIGIGRAPAVH